MDEKYVKNLLRQTLDSFKILTELSDKPGDLITIKQELGKINGLLQVLVNKMEKSENSSDWVFEFLNAVKKYLKNYSFSYEIDNVSELYPEDHHRIKNLRLVILEALEKCKVISNANILLQEL
jgi:hypothetical protein